MASSMDGVMDNQLRVAVMTMRCTTPDSATWGFGNGLNTEMHGIRRPCPRNSIGSRQDVDTTSDEISRTMMPKTSRWTDGIISPRGLMGHVLYGDGVAIDREDEGCSASSLGYVHTSHGRYASAHATRSTGCRTRSMMRTRHLVHGRYPSPVFRSTWIPP